MESEHSTSSNSSCFTEFSPSKSPPAASRSTSSWASSSSSAVDTKKRRAGRKKFRETRHPVYRGVRERNGGKWVCEVREPHKNKRRIWLGTYATPEMAARAHDVAVLALRGKSAQLNFPDSAWLLPRAASATTEDIRSAAARAADMFCSLSSAATSTTPSPSAVLLLSPRRVSRKEEVRAAVEGAEGFPGSSALAQTNTAVATPAFLDEEALFDMPGLLASMAEGMLLTPPFRHSREFDWDDVYCHEDTSLWMP